MTRRRLTRKRSALNPEPNMINTFCGRRGEGHWNQELLVSQKGTSHCFTWREKTKFLQTNRYRPAIPESGYLQMTGPTALIIPFPTLQPCT